MKCVVVTLMTLLGSAAVAHAQGDPLRLTLPDAIARGLAASHRIAELAAREDAARAVEDQREAATRPNIAVAASYTRTNHVEEFGVPNPAGGVRIIYPDIPDNVRSRLDLQWPIYTGGRLQALMRSAASETQATAQDREAARADLKLEITRAYWAVITARASRDVLAQALERINAHLVDVRNQLNVGLVPPSDVLSIEAQQARQQMLAIESENLVDITSVELRRLTGLDPDAPFELLAELEVPAAGGHGIASTPPRARPDRPERRALEFRVDAAAQRVASAAAGRLPVLTAIAGYDVARPNPRIFPIQRAWKPSWDVGVNVRWPVFDGGRVRAETAESMANQRSAEARLRELDANIDAEVRQRAADLRSSLAAVDAAATGVRAAAEARRVLAERFGAGVATNTDVLAAQVALLQAELDRTRALANAKLAAARLDRALGR